MQYVVRGVNFDNPSKQRRFLLEADSEDQARDIAGENGVCATSVTLADSADAFQIPTMQQSSRYPALDILSWIYMLIGVSVGIVCAITALYSVSNGNTSLFIQSAVYGVLTPLLLIAIAQGIRLALDVESHLRAIRSAAGKDAKASPAS